MTAFNIVRFKVKPGREQEFLDIENRHDTNLKGNRRLSIVKTGDRTFCFVGEWDSYEDIVAARPAMIAQLDQVRHVLEDLGGGLGVTDPASGEVVLQKP
jgi:hypothetical protein